MAANLNAQKEVTAITWETIVAAHERIRPLIHRTPVLTSASLNEMAGAALFFKCENLQKTGSFKIRGASNAIFSLSAEEAKRGVVTHSSGNHAAAVARAAAGRGRKGIVGRGGGAGCRAGAGQRRRPAERNMFGSKRGARHGAGIRVRAGTRG